jgi:hypothetical protein
MADFNLGMFRPKPRGVFNSTTSYRYLDLVSYNGSGYICCNEDTIDGIACIGVLPEGQSNSELYWMCIASKGDEGAAASSYPSFITVLDNLWNYEKSDKIIVPENAEDGTLDITNVYDGCCGIIISKKDLSLPGNSDYSVDFNYVTAGTNQYYMYSFIYADLDTGSKFIWNRTVINQ